MEGERYVGERRALRHFLQELRPLVIAALGRDAVLAYRIERALRSGELGALRRAREVFHKQPEELKRRLMRGIFQAPDPPPRPTRAAARDGVDNPELLIRFDAYPSARSEDLGLSVQLDVEFGDDVPVKVLVSPGTLPSSAAEALRQIATWIERDRRLLSARHWQQAARDLTRERETGPGDSTGDSLDQA